MILDSFVFSLFYGPGLVLMGRISGTNRCHNSAALTILPKGVLVGLHDRSSQQAMAEVAVAYMYFLVCSTARGAIRS